MFTCLLEVCQPPHCTASAPHAGVADREDRSARSDALDNCTSKVSELALLSVSRHDAGVGRHAGPTICAANSHRGWPSVRTVASQLLAIPGAGGQRAFLPGSFSRAVECRHMRGNEA